MEETNTNSTNAGVGYIQQEQLSKQLRDLAVNKVPISKEQALAQIKEKKYYQKYLSEAKLKGQDIYIVGVSA